MEAILYITSWVLIGTVVFFARAMLGSLSNKLRLVDELNDLSSMSKYNRDDYYVSLILFHLCFLPIGVALLIGDGVKLLVAHLSKDERRY